MNEFLAKIEIDGELVKATIQAETAHEAVEECWRHFGQSTYIESLRLIEEKEEE